VAEQEVFFLHSIQRGFSSLLLNDYWSCVPNGKAARTISGSFSLSTAKVKNAQRSQLKYYCPQPKGEYLECCGQQHVQVFHPFWDLHFMVKVIAKHASQQNLTGQQQSVAGHTVMILSDS
jgi:hypothetical protein